MNLILDIKTSKGNYDIIISKGILGDLLNYLDEFDFEKIFVITDSNVNNIYGKNIYELLSSKYKVYKKVISSGELSKNINTIADIYGDLADFNMNRTDIIISFGGGVVGDISGFVASTYLRGIRYLQIPTTLISQVDSSIGGKTGIDIRQGKNLVGNFYNPVKVIIDTDVLKTLDEKYFSDGMAEVIKYAFIKDRQLYDILYKSDFEELYNNIDGSMDRIIYICCNIKKMIVEEDEFDTGKRMILNFGHTLGHAIEAYYSYKKYTHGEAISIGMYRVCEILYKNGLIEKNLLGSLKNMMKKFKLPVFDENILNESLLEYIEKDKKNIGKNLKIAIVKDIGKGEIINGNIDFFKEKYNYDCLKK